MKEGANNMEFAIVVLIIIGLISYFKDNTVDKDLLIEKQQHSLAQIEMIFVQGGTYQMGSSDGTTCFRQVYTATLCDYYIGKYQVTQKEWIAIMGSNPSEYKGQFLPVTNVSWFDCCKFIDKINKISGLKYRLPTEAEWEFAAHGGNRSRGYKYSGSDNIDEVAWYCQNSADSTRPLHMHPVGQKRGNELGIHDMTGNVSEWCYDLFGLFSIGEVTGDYRVLRGGSYIWGSYTIYSRNCGSPKYRSSDYGFRLARSC